MKQLTCLLLSLMILFGTFSAALQTRPALSEETQLSSDDTVIETDEDARSLVLNDMGPSDAPG